MRLFKYRDLSNVATADEELSRLEIIVANSAFWCARPDTLNDTEELSVLLDTAPTRSTHALLTQLLIHNRPQPRGEAWESARVAIATGRLGDIAEHAIEEVRAKIREHTGIISFATTNDNATMWMRYGGAGEGVCIELEIPGDHGRRSLKTVQYVDARTIHIDLLIRALFDRRWAERVFKLIYLTKSTAWAEELEYRFVSVQHSVMHHITP